MANRRMFSMQIVDSDAFLDLPQSSQLLYFHLSMRADDDGFVGNPKRIMRMIGSSDDDLKIIFAKRFVIGFESGIVVIKHWRMNNFLRSDRYTETQYVDEKKRLKIKDNGAYTEQDNQLDTDGIPDDIPPVAVGKVRIGKVSREEVRREVDAGASVPQVSKKFIKPTVEEVRAHCTKRGNSVDPEAFIAFYESNGWRVGKNPMKNWQMSVVTWEKRSPSKAQSETLNF